MNQIQVLVVDDSAFMRQTLKAMIEEDPLLHVVATARSGQDALQKLISYRPDVVTLDIVLTDKSGLEVLDDIMSSRPTPTIMVSGASNDAASLVIEAISKGAVVDLFPSRPAGTTGLGGFSKNCNQKSNNRFMQSFLCRIHRLYQGSRREKAIIHLRRAGMVSSVSAHQRADLRPCKWSCRCLQAICPRRSLLFNICRQSSQNRWRTGSIVYHR
ncbi:response regulator [Terrilactibacillus sp. S3-3]|nr:response regulator [Terrilactibacillus sp. S3-3]